MDNHVLFVVIALLLLVAVQAREATSSSSTGTGSSIVDVSPSHITVNTGGSSHLIAVNRQGTSPESSSSSHEATTVEADSGELLSINTDHPPLPSASNSELASGSAAFAGVSSPSLPPLFYSSTDAARSSTVSPESIQVLYRTDAAMHIRGANAGGSASNDETGIVGDAESFTSSRSDSESAVSIVYVSSISSSSSFSEDASQSTATIDIFDGASSYSAGTVAPNTERTAIQSTALELSTSPDQVETTSPPSTSTTYYGKKKTSTTDQATSSNQVNDIDGHTSDLTSSNTNSPIVYACVVLGVAGLIGAVIHAKRKHHSSDEWRATSEASVVTPHMSRRAAWVPPDSRVRVIIDKNNIALL
ncbi:hypothetical protein PC129_g1507 [Phytophthora cactorum]|uniref:Uncharacterized protein n=2 Tax=Phytophthora cactorum TaxID=29920 RepID=A0A8T1IUX4_9STRA|nr:hypothetical protein Pcac1_g14678 [Phytophthora cactorum]KAG2866295.1 hypothetical protein PC113_g2945 [Phytophthora cactorum]KAG2928320.1 hypothetical protein PC114_g3155 [Phytophthora cactorum]KAG2952252.1 hypothetical protein PC117_g2928 [Phytophthora cactorum]KAG2996729.1 hypothetical protein PC118_g2303 [Phytophthora cactorum]